MHSQSCIALMLRFFAALLFNSSVDGLEWINGVVCVAVLMQELLASSDALPVVCCVQVLPWAMRWVCQARLYWQPTCHLCRTMQLRLRPKSTACLPAAWHRCLAPLCSCGRPLPILSGLTLHTNTASLWLHSVGPCGFCANVAQWRTL